MSCKKVVFFILVGLLILLCENDLMNYPDQGIIKTCFQVNLVTCSVSDSFNLLVNLTVYGYMF